MNRYQKLFFRSLSAIFCMLSIVIFALEPNKPIVVDAIKVVWTAMMVALIYLLLSLSVDDFRDQD